MKALVIYHITGAMCKRRIYEVERQSFQTDLYFNHLITHNHPEPTHPLWTSSTHSHLTQSQLLHAIDLSSATHNLSSSAYSPTLLPGCALLTRESSLLVSTHQYRVLT
ncbi:hypothetical protein FRC02_000762 [Tulasnella sp. 418]|nr:hypothetical protein FRC02_000762 [Tulasnella sp. 418]